MPELFFSSCFADPEGQRLTIRDRVMTLNPTVDRNDDAAVRKLPIWLAENQKNLDLTAPTPSLDKAMICIEGVRESETYVAVVRERHGTGVDLSSTERLQASYFELELFEAALLGKPSYVFIMKGAEPGPRITSLLRLLAPALPGLRWEPLEEDEIFQRVETILVRQSRPKFYNILQRAVASGGHMSDLLTRVRHKSYVPARESPPIEFLDGLTDPTASIPQEALVQSILQRARFELNQNSKLSILWLAIRELMGAPISDPTMRSYLPLWDSALSDWNSAAAWFGLHGHPSMGCLAALGSQSRIRHQMAKSCHDLHGALASEYYSIAKNLGSATLKRSMLDASREHISVAMLEGETANLLNIRGSIRGAQGDVSGRIEDFNLALSLRLDGEVSSLSEIGVAKSELGFALVLSGKVSVGIAHLEDGVAMLENCPQLGFLVRAKRKLGRAYLRAGSPKLAIATLAAAHSLANDIKAFDQVSQIDRIAARLDRLFTLRTRPNSPHLIDE